MNTPLFPSICENCLCALIASGIVKGGNKKRKQTRNRATNQWSEVCEIISAVIKIIYLCFFRDDGKKIARMRKKNTARESEEQEESNMREVILGHLFEGYELLRLC